MSVNVGYCASATLILFHNYSIRFQNECKIRDSSQSQILFYCFNSQSYGTGSAPLSACCCSCSATSLLASSSFSNLSFSSNASFSNLSFSNCTLSSSVTTLLLILTICGSNHVTYFFKFQPSYQLAGFANILILFICSSILHSYFILLIWFSLKFKYTSPGKQGNGLSIVFILLFLNDSFYSALQFYSPRRSVIQFQHTYNSVKFFILVNPFSLRSLFLRSSRTAKLECPFQSCTLLIQFSLRFNLRKAGRPTCERCLILLVDRLRNCSLASLGYSGLNYFRWVI